MIGLTLHNLFVQRLMEKQNMTLTNLRLSKFTLKIYHHDLALQGAEDDQQELKILINKLNNNYNPKNPIKTKKKKMH